MEIGMWMGRDWIEIGMWMGRDWDRDRDVDE